MTQGHRITLTYNLYHTVGNGELAGNSPVMDVTTLPLYRKVKEALAAPEFMSDGKAIPVFVRTDAEQTKAAHWASSANMLMLILPQRESSLFQVF